MEGGKKIMPRFTGPLVRRDTSLGVHVRALAEVLVTMVADEADGLPSARRVALRGHLSALVRAYPEYLALNESELAQALAEADGDAVDEAI